MHQSSMKVQTEHSQDCAEIVHPLLRWNSLTVALGLLLLPRGEYVYSSVCLGNCSPPDQKIHGTLGQKTYITCPPFFSSSLFFPFKAYLSFISFSFFPPFLRPSLPSWGQLCDAGLHKSHREMCCWLTQGCGCAWHSPA